MSALNVLKAAASVGQGSVEGALPPHIVRFTLEYASKPDLASERERIASMLGARGFELDPFDPDLPNFAILQFPGVSRTISAPTLLERPPSRRGRNPPPHHIFGHAGLADIDA